MNRTFLKNPAQFTDRDLIASLLGSFFILDYGIVKDVNGDGTINALHAKKQTMLDGTVLPPMETKNIKVLTLSGAGFSLVWDIQKGDKVLLLGLKYAIDNTTDVNTPDDAASFRHYSRETLKAFPLCAFNADAKVTAEIKDGAVKLAAEYAIETECKSSALTVKEDVNTECKNYSVKASQEVNVSGQTCKIDGKQQIQLNGNSKQFVTWAELNADLTKFSILLNTHTHACAAPGGPTSPPVAPMTIDISAAKTTTVVTGG